MVSDNELIAIALHAGFSISTMCGQESPKIMPSTDVATLRKLFVLYEEYQNKQKNKCPHCGVTKLPHKKNCYSSIDISWKKLPCGEDNPISDCLAYCSKQVKECHIRGKKSGKKEK